MIDIFVKSFDRPYYLDRCLASIAIHVKGNYSIKVLDDGTPQHYIAHLKNKYPFATWVLSPNHHIKANADYHSLHHRWNLQTTGVPVQFWKEEIAKGSDYFLLLEEDAWFTRAVELHEYVDTMLAHNVVMLKFFWNNNASIIKGRKVSLNDKVDEIKPALPITFPWVVTALMNNRFKLTSVLQRLKLLPKSFFNPYYSLYTVASGIFLKQYWQFLWHFAHPNHIDEKRQLREAVIWFRQHPNGKYAKSREELIQTSYITSSSTTFRHVAFDMRLLNHQLNEAWIKNELNPMQGYPSDFAVEYLKAFMVSDSPQCSAAEWDFWIQEFNRMHSSSS